MSVHMRAFCPKDVLFQSTLKIEMANKNILISTIAIGELTIKNISYINLDNIVRVKYFH